jgi:ABC-type sugar transport system substrate-binding protein
MASGRVALCLVDSGNEFQQVARHDAEAAARQVGLDIETHWSGAKLSVQLAQLRELVDSPTPPSAILVMAVRDQGLSRIAGDAAKAGIHWVFLNRSEDNVESLRVQHPGLALCQVYPDEVETGRVQASLIEALLPDGGRVLQVQGSMRSVAARDRTAGTSATLDSGRFKLVPLEAGWTEDEGYGALAGWLRVAVRANMRLDVVACHNDLLGKGARRALEDVARDLGKPEVATVPIVGCDGTPAVGQAMVMQGQMAATVVLPRSSGPAVKIVHRALSGQGLPDAVVTLHATPFPDPAELGPRPR